LDKNLLYCLSSDKKSIVYTFNSFKEAALTLTPKRCKHLSDDELNEFKNVRHIKRHVNIAQLTKTELGNFYLVSHRATTLQKKVNKKNIEIFSLDIVTGVIIKHDSINKCLL
jgi:hypothetical protein